MRDSPPCHWGIAATGRNPATVPHPCNSATPLQQCHNPETVPQPCNSATTLQQCHNDNDFLYRGIEGHAADEYGDRKVGGGKTNGQAGEPPCRSATTPRSAGIPIQYRLRVQGSRGSGGLVRYGRLVSAAMPLNRSRKSLNGISKIPSFVG